MFGRSHHGRRAGGGLQVIYRCVIGPALLEVCLPPGDDDSRDAGRLGTGAALHVNNANWAHFRCATFQSPV